MPWFSASSVIFAVWAVLFLFFPRFSNEFGGVGYVTSKHAEDWTQIVGLFAFAFAVLLYEAHCSANADVRRIVARGVLSLTVPSALLMTYWQIIPERRWIRLDIADIALLCFISYGMILQGGSARSRASEAPGGERAAQQGAEADERGPAS
jgi:hypothetical protein